MPWTCKPRDAGQVQRGSDKRSELYLIPMARNRTKGVCKMSKEVKLDYEYRLDNDGHVVCIAVDHHKRLANVMPASLYFTKARDTNLGKYAMMPPVSFDRLDEITIDNLDGHLLRF